MLKLQNQRGGLSDKEWIGEGDGLHRRQDRMLTDLTAHLPRLKMRKVQPRKPKALAEVEVGGGIGAGAGLLPGPPQPPLSTRRTPGRARLGLPFSHTQDSMARNSSHWASSRLWAAGIPSAFQQLPEGPVACSPGIIVPACAFFFLPVQVEHLPPCCLFFLAKVQF